MAICFRKHGDFGPERIVQLLILIAVFVFIRNMFKRVIGIHRALPSHAAPEYFCDIACNSPKPGLQSAAILQFGQFPYSRKQNFLRKLIGFFS